MMSSKEIFMQEHERLCAEAEEAGMSFAAAYNSTADVAFSATCERFADMADTARQRAKDAQMLKDLNK